MELFSGSVRRSLNLNPDEQEIIKIEDEVSKYVVEYRCVLKDKKN